MLNCRNSKQQNKKQALGKGLLIDLFRDNVSFSVESMFRMSRVIDDLQFSRAVVKSVTTMNDTLAIFLLEAENSISSI